MTTQGSETPEPVVAALQVTRMANGTANLQFTQGVTHVTVAKMLTDALGHVLGLMEADAERDGSRIVIPQLQLRPH